MDMMYNPIKHFEVLEKDIHVNGKSISKDSLNAVNAYHRGDFEQFGEFIGNIMNMSTIDEMPLFLY